MVRAFPTPRQRVRGGGWLKSVKKSASYARTQARLPVLLAFAVGATDVLWAANRADGIGPLWNLRVQNAGRRWCSNRFRARFIFRAGSSVLSMAGSRNA